MKISSSYKNILAFLFAIIAIFVIGYFTVSPFIWLFLIFLVFLLLYLFLKFIHLENKNKRQTRTLSITAFVTIIQSTIGENHYTIKVINSSIDLLTIDISISNDPYTAITIIIITAVFLFALNYIWERSPSLATPQESGNYHHSILATKVKNDWISGVLKKSIYDNELVELKLQDISYKYAIRSSQEGIDSESNQYFSSNDIKEIFFESGSKLLITGLAGSGKTTLMLNLIESLLDEEDVEIVPVILSLPDWHQEDEDTFKDWFLSQLSNKYYIPEWLGNEWLIKGHLVPVFEDIDKVDSSIKDNCITNLNKFIKDYAINGVILVARSSSLIDQDSFAVNKVLKVIPLEQEIVENYFASFGEKLEGVLNYFKENGKFRNFIKSPFTLIIVSITFENKDHEFIKEHLNEENGFSETELLKNYVDKALRRKKRFRVFSVNTIKKTLGWLAYNLTKKNKTEFRLEDLQLNWTLEDNDIRVYRFIFFLLWGTYLSVGGILALFVVEHFFSNTNGNLLFFIFNDTTYGKITVGLSGGFLISSSVFIIPPVEANNIRIIGSVSWSWSEFFHFFIPSVGRAFFLIIVLYAILKRLFPTEEYDIYFFILAFALFIFILNTSMYKAWISNPLVESGKPNEGIYLTVKYFIFRTIVSALIVTTVSFITAYLLVENFNTPVSRLDLYAVVAVLFIMNLTVESLTKWRGIDLLNHIGVRLTLLMKGYVPLFFINFLMNCVDRLQLHLKGGSFIFIHPYLQKYYCDLYETKFGVKSSTNDTNNTQRIMGI